ncbi:MAG TPA: response regulator transcription factor [Chloroflexota bacterium]
MGEQIRVMLVDDHAVLREGLRLLMERTPDLKVVGEASNGPMALEVAAQCRPEVVVMDISMPGADGAVVTRQFKERWPNVKVLVLSNYDEDVYVEAVLAAGASGYLLKSAPAREVIEAVRVVYREGSVLPPAIARKVLKNLARFREERYESPPHEQLTAREREILSLAARGYSNRRIADELCLSIRTVENYMTVIYEKLGVEDRTAAVLYALRKGLAPLTEEVAI